MRVRTQTRLDVLDSQPVVRALFADGDWNGVTDRLAAARTTTAQTAGAREIDRRGPGHSNAPSRETTTMLMHADRSVLVVIDVQERLCPVMDDPRRVLFNGARLLSAANRLSVPVICTEQYPKGLGPTMIDLRTLLPEGAVMEKTAFGAMAEAPFRQALAELDRPQIVLCGTETHVCVLQTALGLREAGHAVFVVADACGSRRPESERAGLERMAAAGCGVVSTEMVLFEWLGDKTNPAFKDISALVK